MLTSHADAQDQALSLRTRGVQERLNRVRALLAASPPATTGDPGYIPAHQFRRHHTDWGGFLNGGEIAN